MLIQFTIFVSAGLQRCLQLMAPTCGGGGREEETLSFISASRAVVIQKKGTMRRISGNLTVM